MPLPDWMRRPEGAPEPEATSPYHPSNWRPTPWETVFQPVPAPQPHMPLQTRETTTPRPPLETYQPTRVPERVTRPPEVEQPKWVQTGLKAAGLAALSMISPALAGTALSRILTKPEEPESEPKRYELRDLEKIYSYGAPEGEPEPDVVDVPRQRTETSFHGFGPQIGPEMTQEEALGFRARATDYHMRQYERLRGEDKPFKAARAYRLAMAARQGYLRYAGEYFDILPHRIQFMGAEEAGLGGATVTSKAPEALETVGKAAGALYGGPRWKRKEPSPEELQRAQAELERAGAERDLLRDYVHTAYGDTPESRYALAHAEITAWSGRERMERIIDRIMHGDDPWVAREGYHVDLRDPSQEDEWHLAQYVNAVKGMDGEEAAREALEKVHETGYIPHEQDVAKQLLGEIVVDPVDWVGASAGLILNTIGKVTKTDDLGLATRVWKAASKKASEGLYNKLDSVRQLVEEGRVEKSWWRKLNPWELTPEAKQHRFATNTHMVTTVLYEQVKNADQAVAMTKAAASNPGALKPILGQVINSKHYEDYVRPLMGVIAEKVDGFKSIKAARKEGGVFSPGLFRADMDRALWQAAEELFEAGEGNRFRKAANAYRQLASEFYLRTPGYIVRNTSSDLFTMYVDGVRFGDSLDDQFAYLKRIGTPTPRVEGEVGGAEYLVGESKLPGVIGRISEFMGTVSRKGAPGAEGASLLGEEPRYAYAFAYNYKKLWQDAWQPQISDELARELGPELTEFVNGKLKRAVNFKELDALADTIEWGTPGSLIEVTKYMDDPGQIPAGILARLEDDLREVTDPSQVAPIIARYRDEIEEHIGKVLSQDPQIPRGIAGRLEDLQDISEEAAQLEIVGKRAGLSDEQIQEAVQAIERRTAQRLSRHEDVAGALAAATAKLDDRKGAREIIRIVYNDVRRGKITSRKARDAARDEAFELLRRGADKAAVWPDYFAKVSGLVDERWTRVDDAMTWGTTAVKRLAQGDALADVMEGRKLRDTVGETMQMYRDMVIRIQEHARAEAKWGVKIEDFNVRLARNRMTVDNAEDFAWEMLAENPSRAGFDYIYQAEDQVRELAQGTAYKAGQIREAWVAGDLELDEFITQMDEVWEEFFLGATSRYQQATYQVLQGGTPKVPDVIAEAAERAGVALDDLAALEPEDWRKVADELDFLRDVRARTKGGYFNQIADEAIDKMPYYRHPNHVANTLAVELDEYETGEDVQKALDQGEIDFEHIWETLWEHGQRRAAEKAAAKAAPEMAAEAAEEAPRAAPEAAERAAREAKEITREVTTHTEAPSINNPTKRYEFEHKIVDLDDVETSDVWHGSDVVENKDYPRELQLRIRGRAASRSQAEKIARQLQPDMLVDDVKSIDRGSPIVGPDNIVESGNGRILGLRRARKDRPENYERYVDYLTEHAEELGLDPSDFEGVAHPVLVRERISDVDRAEFAAEANKPVKLLLTALENARADRKLLSAESIANLKFGEDVPIETALRTEQNRDVVRRFVGKLPEGEQAQLQDEAGDLSAEGISRIKWAMFSRVYGGEAGDRLLAEFVEAQDPDMLNVRSAMLESLPHMAKAEALIDAGRRDEALRLGNDIAEAIDRYRLVRADPNLSVSDFLSQPALFGEPMLTPKQRALFKFLHEQGMRRKTPLRDLLRKYANWVEALPPKGQMGFGGAMARQTPAEVLNEFAEQLIKTEEPLFQGLSRTAAGGAPSGAELAGEAAEVVGEEAEAVSRVAGAPAAPELIPPLPEDEIWRWLVSAENQADLLESVPHALSDAHPSVLSGEAMDALSKMVEMMGDAEPPTAGRAARYLNNVQLGALDAIEEGVKRDLPRLGAVADRPVDPELTARLAQHLQELKPIMGEQRVVTTQAAKAASDRSLLDYRNRHMVDELISTAFTYHFWQSRSVKNWIMRLARRPGLVGKALRYNTALEKINTERGTPERLGGSWAVRAKWLPDWMGDTLYVNPYRTVVPFTSLAYTDFEDADESRNALDYLYRVSRNAGYRLHAPLEIALLASGAAGEGKRAIGMLTPQTAALRGSTAMARAAGAKAIPPQGINLEAPFKRAMGASPMEMWDPYRIADELDAHVQDNPDDVEAAGIAMMLLRRVVDQEMTLNEAMGIEPSLLTSKRPGERKVPIVERIQAKYDLTDEQVRRAQEVLARGVNRAYVRRGVSQLGSFLGLPAQIYSRGERLSDEQLQDQFSQTYSELTGLGSREELEAWREQNPDEFVQWMKGYFVPKARGEFGAEWEPAEIFALTQYQQQADEVDAHFEARVNDQIKKEPYNTRAPGEIRSEQYEAKAALRRQAFGEGEDPDAAYVSSVYGATPREVADTRFDDILGQVSRNMPKVHEFTDEEGEVDYEAYEEARDEYMATLPAVLAANPTILAIRREMGHRTVHEVLSGITMEDVEGYWQRNDTTMEAVQRAWQDKIYSRAWENYRNALDRGEDKSEAWEQYIEPVGEIDATQLIPEVRDVYDRRWDARDLRKEYEGVTFPAVEDAWLARKPEAEREATEAKNAFWEFYSERLPPGYRSRTVKNHPVIETILDRETRGAAAPEGYEMGLRLMQDWVAENEEQDWGTTKDWERAKELSRQFSAQAEKRWPNIYDLFDEYYALPTSERGDFRDAHPEIGQYYDMREAFGERYPIYAYYYLRY